MPGTCRSSLKLADSQGLKTIAFPAISTGVYGYPIGEAADVGGAFSSPVHSMVAHPVRKCLCCSAELVSLFASLASHSPALCGQGLHTHTC